MGSVVLLWVPGRQVLGAALLACTMIGAVLAHLVILGPSPLPALVLGVFSAAVLYLHRDQIALIRSQYRVSGRATFHKGLGDLAIGVVVPALRILYQPLLHDCDELAHTHLFRHARRPAAHPLALVGILVEEPPGIVDALDIAVANAIAEQVIVSF